MQTCSFIAHLHSRIFVAALMKLLRNRGQNTLKAWHVYNRFQHTQEVSGSSRTLNFGPVLSVLLQ